MSLLKDKNNGCQCKAHCVHLTARHASWLICACLIIGFFVFVSGYFLGKKKGVEEFSHMAIQESLADKIYSSICTLYEKEPSSTQGSCINEASTLPDDGQKNNSFDIIQTPTDQTALVNSSQDITQQEQITVGSEITMLEDQKNEHYYAQLIGFGTKRAADRFALRLCKQDIPVHVVARESKTARGKTITWYQVITEKIPSKAGIQAIVDRIKKTEQLHDVRIAAC